MRRSAVAVLAVAVAALMFGACNSDDNPGDSSSSTAPLSSVSTTTEPRTRPSGTVTTTTRTPRTPTADDLAAVRVAVQPVADGFDSPVDIAFRPAGRGRPGTMYVVEQSGALRIVRAGRIVGTALDLSDNLSGGNEQGFLGATFSPDGKRLYVDYTDANGDSNIDEYRMQGDRVDPSSRRQVMFVDQPFSNHNGGGVVFGPDGMLYIGFGDGGSAGDPQGNAQNLSTLLGKILRIDPTAHGGAPYTVPKNNPFVGRAGVAREVWMWGLRNPWRFSFDRATGDVWIGDVGQNAFEEIDFAAAGDDGVNWGWNAREGAHDFAGSPPPGARDPIVETGRDNGECAIVGGYVYRGRAIPSLEGVHLFGDNCRPTIFGVVQRGGRALAQRDLGITVDALTTFGQDHTGELYAAARSGAIYQFVPG
jgi:glucose/arabinose dehydrogenase